MRLPFLRSKEDPASERGRAAATAAGDLPQDATQARTRARQRLVGALVLLAVGVIGFPMLFETQPRPLPVDTPIEIVRQDGSVGVATAPAAAGKVRPVTLPPPDAGVEAAPAASAAVVALSASSAPSTPSTHSTHSTPPTPPTPPTPTTLPTPPASAPAPARPPKEEAPRERPAQPPAAATPAAPAAPPPASAAQAARFVVQAGAYLDATSLRDARQKVEKLGLKTYTQVVETPTGKRTRVRVGPFENRSEADSVAARIKATGLSVVVLTL